MDFKKFDRVHHRPSLRLTHADIGYLVIILEFDARNGLDIQFDTNKSTGII